MGAPTDFQNETWSALAKIVLARLKRKSRENLLYGDLSEAIYGHRQGGRAFKTSLHAIHVRTNDYNLKNRTRHPRLNSIVWNEEGEQPGIPEYQAPEEVWAYLAGEDNRYLRRLGLLLGFQESRADLPANGAAAEHPGHDTGPRGAGERSSATWNARHSPLVDEIVGVLRDLGWKGRSGATWKPDVYFGSPQQTSFVLMEVKPTSSVHDVVTAIGQLVCYRSTLSNPTCMLAIPGVRNLPSRLSAVLRDQQIRLLDLDSNVRRQLTALAADVTAHEQQLRSSPPARTRQSRT